MGAFITVVAFIGAAATLVATLAEYWQELVEWVKKCINAVKKLIEGIVYGFKVFITKVSEAIKEISKHYSKEGNQWTETIQTRVISADEVPDEILAKARYNKETDITEDMEEQLELA